MVPSYFKVFLTSNTIHRISGVNVRARKKPKVSIIIPVKNDARVLERLLSSIRRQTYAPIEIIVVDGHSKDNSREIAKSYGAHVILEKKHCCSPANARNEGVRHSTGDILAVLDADNELVEDDFIAEVVKSFSSGVVGVYLGTVYERRTPIQECSVLTIKENLPASESFYPVFASRQLVMDVGYWNANLGLFEDLERALRWQKLYAHKKYKIKFLSKIHLKISTPEDLRELFSQQRWYGRTLFYALNKVSYPHILKQFLKIFLAASAIAPLLYFISPLLALLGLPFYVHEFYRIVKYSKFSKFAYCLPIIDFVKGAGITIGVLQYFAGLLKLKRERDKGR